MTTTERSIHGARRIMVSLACFVLALSTDLSAASRQKTMVTIELPTSPAEVRAELESLTQTRTISILDDVQRIDVRGRAGLLLDLTNERAVDLYTGTSSYRAVSLSSLAAERDASTDIELTVERRETGRTNHLGGQRTREVTQVIHAWRRGGNLASDGGWVLESNYWLGERDAELTEPDAFCGRLGRRLRRPIAGLATSIVGLKMETEIEGLALLARAARESASLPGSPLLSYHELLAVPPHLDEPGRLSSCSTDRRHRVILRMVIDLKRRYPPATADDVEMPSGFTPRAVD